MNQSLPPDPIFYNPDYHALIGLIYDSINSRDGFFPFLKRFVEVFNAHSGSFAIYDTRSNNLLGYWVVNIPENALAFYVEHIAHQDALVETAIAVCAREGSKFVASNLDIENVDVVSRETRANEWLASFGAREAAGAIAYQSENYLNFLALQRSFDQPEFTREELAVFDLFLPHINRAVGLYTQLSVIDTTTIPERAALNQVQQGILICDATFRVAFKNRTAENIIANNPALQLNAQGLLAIRDKDFSRRLTLALSSAVQASLTASMPAETALCYRNGNQNLAFIVSPLSAGVTESNARGGAMITLYDWARRPSVSPEVLQRFFGFSPAESRVSALLLAGQSPTEVAQELSRSRETVKSHLQSIYRKTNTRRQGELVALLAATTGLG